MYLLKNQKTKNQKPPPTKKPAPSGAWRRDYFPPSQILTLSLCLLLCPFSRDVARLPAPRTKLDWSKQDASLGSPLALSAFRAQAADSYLPTEHTLLLLATGMAHGKGGFNELLFSFRD